MIEKALAAAIEPVIDDLVALERRVETLLADLKDVKGSFPDHTGAFERIDETLKALNEDVGAIKNVEPVENVELIEALEKMAALEVEIAEIKSIEPVEIDLDGITDKLVEEVKSIAEANRVSEMEEVNRILFS